MQLSPHGVAQGTTATAASTTTDPQEGGGLPGREAEEPPPPSPGPPAAHAHCPLRAHRSQPGQRPKLPRMRAAHNPNHRPLNAAGCPPHQSLTMYQVPRIMVPVRTWQQPQQRVL